MPPIEVSMIRGDELDPRLSERILPGNNGWYADFRTSPPTSVVVVCPQDDKGAQVHAFIDTSKRPDTKMVLSDATLYQTIEPGGRAEYDIITATRKAAKLIVKHVLKKRSS